MNSFKEINKGWDGKPVPKNETDDTIIYVWEISPHVDNQYDYCVVRDYHRAVEVAQETIAQEMDANDKEDLEKGIEIKIKLSIMKLGEYKGLQE